MSRRGENIYRRSDGRYEGRYVIGKKLNGSTQFGYIYGNSYGDVKKRLIQKKNELTNNSQSGSCSISLREWVRRWQMLKLRSRVKPTTEQTYHTLLKNYILPVLGNEDLATITVEKVIWLITQMKTQKYSMTTISFTLHLLSAILNTAVEYELIRNNPCMHIGTVKNDYIREQRVLTREEQITLEETNDLSILLALHTGMRVGELCGLKWSDIDWSANTITVRRTVQRVKQKDGTTKLIENTPKTIQSFRIIPLSDKLRERLEKLSGRDEEFILGKKGRACDPRTLQRRLKVITERNGIKDIHFHSLRHTFATRMVTAGTDMKTVSTLLGHSTVNTTLNIYTHSNLELKKEAIRKLTEQDQ